MVNKAGFTVKVKSDRDPEALQARKQIPAGLQACHVAIVDGYIIEGHVPVAEIERLIAERPDIVGLAVAGMPAGSPGMENEDGVSQPFDVLAINKSGTTTIFASYPM